MPGTKRRQLPHLQEVERDGKRADRFELELEVRHPDALDELVDPVGLVDTWVAMAREDCGVPARRDRPCRHLHRGRGDCGGIDSAAHDDSDPPARANALSDRALDSRPDSLCRIVPAERERRGVGRRPVHVAAPRSVCKLEVLPAAQPRYTVVEARAIGQRVTREPMSDCCGVRLRARAKRAE